MGRRCAWCETVLPSHGGACSPASSSICRGCFEELEIALVRSGLRSSRLAEGSSRLAEANAEGPVLPQEGLLPRGEAFSPR